MSRLPHLWYRALLLLYPSEFRRRFDAEMMRVLAEQELDASARSRGERWWSRSRATCDLIRVAIRERVATVSTAIRVIGMLLVAAAAMQVIYDLATPKLSMGYYAWALTVMVCSFGVILTTATTRNDRRRSG